MKETKENVLNRNVLLRLTGEQDAWAFGKVCKAIDDCTTEESGGKVNACIQAEGDDILIFVKEVSHD